MVGAGGVATRHARSLASLPGVEVTAVTDVDPARAAELARSVGARVAGSVVEVLEQGVDAVYICVPPSAHGAAERAAVTAGVPFFVEKPLAADRATAEDLATEVAAAGLITATGYHWRYLDTVARAVELLGDRPARLVTARWLGKVPPPAWWVDPAASGGQIVEQATHVLDLARVLAGEVVAAQGFAGIGGHRAHPDLGDVAAGVLSFADGAVGTVATTCLLGWNHSAGLAVYADGLALDLTEDALSVTDGRGTTIIRSDPAAARSAADRDFVAAVRGEGNEIRAPYAEALRTHRVACALAGIAALP